MNTSPKRDPLDIFIGWTIAISLTLLAACVSVLSPLAYLWLIGTIGMVAIFAATLTVAGALWSNGGIGFLFAGDVLRLGLDVIGAILAALADASN